MDAHNELECYKKILKDKLKQTKKALQVMNSAFSRLVEGKDSGLPVSFTEKWMDDDIVEIDKVLNLCVFYEKRQKSIESLLRE